MMSIEERIEILRIFAEVEDFDFIREMSSEQLWKLMLIASMVLDVGKEKIDSEDNDTKSYKWTPEDSLYVEQGILYD